MRLKWDNTFIFTLPAIFLSILISEINILIHFTQGNVCLSTHSVTISDMMCFSIVVMQGKPDVFIQLTALVKFFIE